MSKSVYNLASYDYDDDKIQERIRVLTGMDTHRGQYSDATLNELESQNDGQVEGILGKVKILKDVCLLTATTVLSLYTRTNEKNQELTRLRKH